MTTPITGYRALTEAELAAINEIKALAEQVGALVESLQNRPVLNPLDKRWLAIGKTELQQGFMALTRAIAQPTTF